MQSKIGRRSYWQEVQGHLDPEGAYGTRFADITTGALKILRLPDLT